MKWMRARLNGQELFGTLDGDALLVFEGELFGEHRPTGQRLPLTDLQWLTPCRPGKMLALWNNFRAAAEKNGWAVPAEPLYFVKTPNSYAAHGQAIAAPPPEVGRVAYEGELAVVIGRRARGVTAEQAREHIFGYACANDLTAIELLHRDPAFAQWTRAKGFDGFGVFGPVIETDFDAASASVRTLVGGRERQNYPLADMIFPPHELVARLSQDMTLEPGDVILCGTSLGVLPMKPGTEVAVEIDGIGRLVNTFG
ncbi:fumarylacetoacetate hydrolase family protein [Ideonella sp. 4Y11]|uniref:Fumarylacetoacetate hydrolase family protein n=1 Tax=Ideonella aquatica TaxID=2824119 RepID=A0A940YGI6_9BURK|nr:fumarylacetoacetate hydrolase family protein [Ideonella aquatica]MBQ0959793.1 fumarylacetoacetate hydrolase family protein [Ideonella aquatica]